MRIRMFSMPAFIVGTALFASLALAWAIPGMQVEGAYEIMPDGELFSYPATEPTPGSQQKVGLGHIHAVALTSTFTAYLPMVSRADKPEPVCVLLEDFESNQPWKRIFPCERASVSLSQGALRMSGTGAPWHIGGVYLDPRPVDLASFDTICIEVKDMVGSNTLGLWLGKDCHTYGEVWSDWPNACDRSRTTQGEWVQMCFNLPKFQGLVDLSAIDMVAMNMYWRGDYYFDNIKVCKNP